MMTGVRSYGEIIEAAGAAKTAIRILRKELAKTNVGADRALDNLSSTVESLDEETHPLTMQELFLFGDFRWPHRKHWDQWAWSIERIADGCSATILFTEEYDYLQVEIVDPPNPSFRPAPCQNLQIMLN